MIPSDNCLKLVKFSEALRTRAYLDTGNVPTIGWGHTGGVKLGDTCTRYQAEAWIAQDILSAVRDVEKLVSVPLNQNQFDALVSFVFNIGGSQFRTSTLRRLLNDGLYTQAAAQFPRWKFDNGKVQPGLVVRRDSERALFERPWS